MKVNRALLRQTETAWLWIAITITLAVLQAITLVAQAYLISRVISGAFLRGERLPQLQDELLLLLLLIALRLVFTTLTKVTAVHAATRVKMDVRKRLLEHFHRLGPVALSGEHSGELVHSAHEGIESLDAYISEYLPQVALAALIPFTIVAVILPLDLTSAFVLLLTAPLIPFFMVLVGDTAEEMSRRQWKTLGNLSARFLDVLQGLATLKMFGQSQAQSERLRQLGESHRNATMRVLRVAFLSALVLELVATISTAIVAVQVGLRLLYGRLDFEAAFFVLILAPEFYLPLRTLGAKFHAGISGAVAMEHIFEILNQTAAHPKEMPHLATHEPDRAPLIQFRNVHFRYPQRTQSALQGIDLTLEAGKRSALVGPTGGGKSTLAHLLLSFIEPEQGEILINGRPMSEIDPNLWRRSIAWVPQHPYLFNTSVLENLLIASRGASIQKVEQAARLASAHAFISRLPFGYNTPVGENAFQLSAGQAQRIALARAFLKDAPLVILDEATSNLDRETETEISASIDKLLSGRTALLIAHRLDTIVAVDEILVIASGRILERGSHTELMHRSGLYADLQKAYRGVA